MLTMGKGIPLREMKYLFVETWQQVPEKSMGVKYNILQHELRKHRSALEF